ncbi:MAG: phage tail assembly protein [Burkholderiales bacterium]|nr:phage tail assembly protein [Burkholderiales bacterium]
MTDELENKTNNLTIVRQFKHGLTIAGVSHKEFEIHEASLADMLDAEKISPASSPMNFNAELAVRQLVRVGDFTGPFTLNLLKRLRPADWWTLRDAQEELGAMGEGE